MSVICNHCKGLGTTLDGDTCATCHGFKVLNPFGKPYSGSESLESDASRPSLLYMDTKDLMSALNNILKGKWEDNFSYGFVAGLIANGVEDLEGESLEDKQKWLDSMLKRGEILVDYDSIWSVMDGVGVRVHRFDAERSLKFKVGASSRASELKRERSSK